MKLPKYCGQKPNLIVTSQALVDAYYRLIVEEDRWVSVSVEQLYKAIRVFERLESLEKVKAQKKHFCSKAHERRYMKSLEDKVMMAEREATIILKEIIDKVIKGEDDEKE